MIKKALPLVLASALFASGFTACGSKNEPASVPSNTATTSKDKFANTVTLKVAKSSKEAIKCNTTLREDYMKEKLNLVLDLEEIAQNDFKMKLQMLFASGNGPDMIDSIRPETGLTELTDAGFLKGFTQDEIAKLVPNYRKVWEGDEWDTIYKIARYSDNKIYNFYGKRSQLVDMTWEYRKDIFDKYKLSFPKTPDEFLAVSKVLKEKEGKDVLGMVNPAGANPMYAFSWAFQMYGAPDLGPKWLSFQDPATKQFIPYIFSDDKFREAAKFINKYYTSGYVWKEFATATEEQCKKYRSQGHGFMLWGYPYKEAEYESYSKNVYPDADWDWSRDWPSAFSDKTYYKASPLPNDGPSLNAKLSSEKLDRALAYINWQCSEEGMIFNTYGIEGQTYQKKDGKMLLLDKMQSPTNPTGERFGTYLKGLGGTTAAYPYSHPEYEKVYSAIKVDVTDVVKGKKNYYGHKEPLFQYKGDQLSRIADISSAMKPITDEYYLKFAVGQLDPAKDDDWKAYQNALKKVGLDEFIKIRTEAFNLANK